MLLASYAAAIGEQWKGRKSDEMIAVETELLSLLQTDAVELPDNVLVAAAGVLGRIDFAEFHKQNPSKKWKKDEARLAIQRAATWLYGQVILKRQWDRVTKDVCGSVQEAKLLLSYVLAPHFRRR